MQIDCVVIAYALTEDLYRLFAAAAAPNVRWRLFLHSQHPLVMQCCNDLCTKYPVVYYPYGENRGLARSWNEGVIAAYGDGADVAVLINDDMIPGPGDVQRVAQAALEHPECGIVKCNGFDLRDMQHKPMEFGLTPITKRGWEVVGCFDENIWPIYWEDIDYGRRLHLAGLTTYFEPCTSAIHAGSKTTVAIPGFREQIDRWYAANEAYYVKKWNGGIGKETFTRPFDNPEYNIYINPGNRHNPYPECR